VDAAAAYCEANTPTGRKVVREQITPAAKEKDMAICLRCPGDDKTYCAGDAKALATD